MKVPVIEFYVWLVNYNYWSRKEDILDLNLKTDLENNCSCYNHDKNLFLVKRSRITVYVRALWREILQTHVCVYKKIFPIPLSLTYL